MGFCGTTGSPGAYGTYVGPIEHWAHEGSLIRGNARRWTGGPQPLPDLARNNGQRRGAQVVKDIDAAGGQAYFLAADLRDGVTARSLAMRAIEKLGQVDVLVNNAGTFPFGPTDKMSEQDFDAVFALNVKAPFFLVAELAPRMAERGYGAIVPVDGGRAAM